MNDCPTTDREMVLDALTKVPAVTLYNGKWYPMVGNPNADRISSILGIGLR